MQVIFVERYNLLFFQAFLGLATTNIMLDKR